MGKRKRRLHSPKYAKKYASVRAAYAKLRGEVEEALVDGVVTEEEAAKIEKAVKEVEEAVKETAKEVKETVEEIKAEEETPKTKLKSKSRSAKFSSRKKTPDSSRGKRKPAKKK